MKEKEYLSNHTVMAFPCESLEATLKSRKNVACCRINYFRKEYQTTIFRLYYNQYIITNIILGGENTQYAGLFCSTTNCYSAPDRPLFLNLGSMFTRNTFKTGGSCFLCVWLFHIYFVLKIYIVN